MSQFQIYFTDDIITLESKRQAIAVIGFSLSGIENISKNYFSQRIFNYFDSFGYTYIIQIRKTSLRFFLLIPAENAGEVINKVSILLDKMDKVGSIDPFLMFSPLNHSNVATFIQSLYKSSMKQTNNPKIVEMENSYHMFTSLSFTEFKKNYVEKYIKDLLSYKGSTLNLSSRFIKRTKSRIKDSKSIMFSFSFSSFNESLKFLKHLENISLHYKTHLSFSLRFHSYYEIRRRKLLFLLGTSSYSESSYPWSDFINIERFIPDIRKKRKIEKQEEIIDKQIETQTVEKEQYQPLVPFGKELPEEEISKLVKTIPPPPS